MPDAPGQMTIADREMEIADLKRRIARATDPKEAALLQDKRDFAAESLRRIKSEPDTLDRNKRLRRCLLTCCHFARNLAYHRARREVAKVPSDDFWISADANFIDFAVLEWFKMFGDNKAEHGWLVIAMNYKKFHDELLIHLEMSTDDWRALIKSMRKYRDKFVAHLDSELNMNIPNLDKALRAAQFYYLWILKYEFGNFDREGIPSTLEIFYSERLTEAVRVYSAMSGTQNKLR